MMNPDSLSLSFFLVITEKYDEFLDDMEWLVENYAAAEEDHNNEYYTSIAMGFFYDAETNTTYLVCMATME